MFVKQWLAACAVFAALCARALAADFPAKPVVIVVPYAAGGAADFVARTVAAKLSTRLKQPVVVENVGGASGTIGAAKVVAAAPDGYTLLLGSGSEVSIARLTNPKIRYDGQRDLAPVALVGTQPLVLVGSNSLSARTMDEVLALARANPGKLNYGTAGVGTPQHLMGELINLDAKVKLFHVPYKGAAPIINDLLGKQLDLAVVTLSGAQAHVKSGGMRAIALSEKRRATAMPQVPTVSETRGLESVDMGVWSGLLAPAKTPPEVVDLLNREIGQVLRQPDVQARLTEAGYRIVGGSPASFAEFISAETDKYRRIVQAAGIQAE